jgi:hypothetical protein
MVEEYDRSGQIKLEEFGAIAKRFIATLDGEAVSDFSDLENMLYGITIRQINIDESKKDRVFIEMRPSEIGTQSITVSYVIPGIGIPIEFKYNCVFEYAKIFLKLEKVLPLYEAFSYDQFGNVIQSRLFTGIEYSEVKNEIKSLCNSGT